MLPCVTFAQIVFGVNGRLGVHAPAAVLGEHKVVYVRSTQPPMVVQSVKVTLLRLRTVTLQLTVPVWNVQLDFR